MKFIVVRLLTNSPDPVTGERASATKSGTDFTGRLGLTSSSIGIVAASEMGVKSVSIVHSTKEAPADRHLILEAITINDTADLEALLADA